MRESKVKRRQRQIFKLPCKQVSIKSTWKLSKEGAMRIPLVVFCAFAAAAVADDALVVASALQPLAEERSGWVLYISTDFN